MATDLWTHGGKPMAGPILTCAQCRGTAPETAKAHEKAGMLGCLGCTAWISILPLMPFVTFLSSQLPLTR